MIMELDTAILLWIIKMLNVDLARPSLFWNSKEMSSNKANVGFPRFLHFLSQSLKVLRSAVELEIQQ